MELKYNSAFRGILTLLTAGFLLAGTMGGLAQASQGDLPGEAPFTVVLDAGHGGHDPGNLGNGFLEKDIALNIVLAAGASLKKNPNVKVVFTRDDDTFVDLYKRGEIANKAKADLFVSVHCDSHSSDAHGAGTFVLGLHANKQNFEVAKKENSVIYLEDNYEARYADYDINSPESVIGLTIMQEEFLDQSILLGKLMQDRFTGKLNRKDRKVKQAGFIVLHQTFMPSVLIETGFLTNKDEGKYLNSKKGQEEMGAAIADAILEYKNNVRSVSPQVTADLPKATPVEQKKPEPEPTQPEPAQPETPADKPAEAAAGQAVAVGEINDSALKSDKLPDMAGNPDTTQPVAAAQTEAKQAGDPGKTEPDPALADPARDKAPVTEVEATRPVTPPLEDSDISFKVQLMAVSKDIPLAPANFNGLNTLSKEPVGGMYRILYGNTTSYEQAKLLQAGAQQKGYAQAYIVAYRAGERIPVEKALQLLSN